jgi:hypothetical protein
MIIPEFTANETQKEREKEGQTERREQVNKWTERNKAIRKRPCLIF